MAGSPCGACKFLRRKCTANCIFAPYFGSENSMAGFAAIHRIFGASNASKLLQNVPAGDRSEAAATIAYEAHARLCDPVYGCVAHIFALQQQVGILQSQVMHARAQLVHCINGASQLDSRRNYQISSCFNTNYSLINGYSKGKEDDSGKLFE